MAGLCHTRTINFFLLIVVASTIIFVAALQISGQRAIGVERRVYQIRGVAKSGTTWLEVFTAALLACHSRPLEELDSLESVLHLYDRSKTEFIVACDITGREVAYSLEVLAKHDWSKWPLWPGFAGASQERTLIVFRDPKDVALSFSDYFNTEDHLLVYHRAETELRTIFERANFNVEQLLRGEHVSTVSGNTFLLSYELARFCLEKTLSALGAFMQLPQSRTEQCTSFVKQVASLVEMGRVEDQGMLPGIKNKRKVGHGGVCRSFELNQEFPSSNLPQGWANFFGETECTMNQSIKIYSQSSLHGQCEPFHQPFD